MMLTGAASGVAPDSRDGDKDGTNLMRSEKGARLMPTRSLEGITGTIELFSFYALCLQAFG